MGEVPAPKVQGEHIDAALAGQERANHVADESNYLWPTPQHPTGYCRLCRITPPLAAPSWLPIPYLYRNPELLD